MMMLQAAEKNERGEEAARLLAIMDEMLVTQAEGEALRQQGQEKEVSKSYVEAVDLFDKAAERFLVCGFTSEATACNTKKDAVMGTLALLEQAKMLIQEATKLGTRGVDACDIDAIEEATTLLTAAINILTKVEAPGASTARELIKLLQGKEKHLRKGMEKAAAAEEAATQELWESAAELFRAARRAFEAAGCKEYATMAEKKWEVAIKHSKKAAKKRKQRKFGDPPHGERPDETLDPMGAKRWDEEMKRCERERAELIASKPSSAAQNLAQDAKFQAQTDADIVANLEEELRKAKEKGGGLDNDYQIRKLEAELEAGQASAHHSGAYAADMEGEVKRKEAEEKEEELRLARCKLNPAERTEQDRQNRADSYMRRVSEGGLTTIPVDKLCQDIALRAQFRVARVDKLDHAGGERVWLLTEESRTLSGPTLHMVRVGRQVTSSGCPNGHMRSVEELFVLLQFYQLKRNYMEVLAWRTEYTEEELALLFEYRNNHLWAEESVIRAYAEIECPDQNGDAWLDQSIMQPRTKRPTRFHVNTHFR